MASEIKFRRLMLERTFLASRVPKRQSLIRNDKNIEKHSSPSWNQPRNSCDRRGGKATFSELGTFLVPHQMGACTEEGNGTHEQEHV